MSNNRLSALLIVPGLVVLVMAGAAEAIETNNWFPLFGVVNGVQGARINAVLAKPPESDLPCPVSLVFIDSEGHSIGNPDIFQLRGGAAVGVNFIGNPDVPVGERLEIRAQVTIADLNQFPGCADGVLTSVEVVDRRTRSTRIILTNPVVQGGRGPF